MRELTIYRLYFTNSDCFKKGTVQTPRGVQVHSTGANNPWLRRYVGPDDGRLGLNPNGNTHNRPGGNVCANAYIGRLADGTVAVYQTLPWNYRCWLSGSGTNGNANRLGYVGFEICEDSTLNEEYFSEAVRSAAVLLAAYLCREFDFTPWSALATPVGDAYAVEDHAGLHRMGLASNHGDIGLWLKKFGYTMKDFRAWVQAVLEEGVEVTYVDALEKEGNAVDHPVLRRGESGEAVIYLQTLLCDVCGALTVDGRFGAMTEAAVRAFQHQNQLTVDGIVGQKTWKALEKATAHETDEETSAESADGTVTLSASDWAAIKAACSNIHQTVKKYENVG